MECKIHVDKCIAQRPASAQLNCHPATEPYCQPARLLLVEITEFKMTVSTTYSSRKSRTSVRRRFSAMSIWFSKSYITTSAQRINNRDANIKHALVWHYNSSLRLKTAFRSFPSAIIQINTQKYLKEPCVLSQETARCSGFSYAK